MPGTASTTTCLTSGLFCRPDMVAVSSLVGRLIDDRKGNKINLRYAYKYVLLLHCKLY